MSALTEVNNAAAAKIRRDDGRDSALQRVLLRALVPGCCGSGGRCGALLRVLCALGACSGDVRDRSRSLDRTVQISKSYSPVRCTTNRPGVFRERCEFWMVDLQRRSDAATFDKVRARPGQESSLF